MKLKLVFIIVVLFAVTVFTIIIIKPFGGDKGIAKKEEIIKPFGGNMEITKEEAIKIANKEVIRLGYNPKSMDVRISKYNTPWNPGLPKDSKSEYDIERQNKLKGKEYWAVYYAPKPSTGIVFGGSVSIFVDANNGEIITDARYK